MAMHPDLDSRLKKWKEGLANRLNAENAFRKADALKKCIFAEMLLKEREAATVKGEKVSVSELEYRVQASKDWRDLVVALGEAESQYNFSCGEYEIKQNAYYGMLASVKIESGHLDKKAGA